MAEHEHEQPEKASGEPAVTPNDAPKLTEPAAAAEPTPETPLDVVEGALAGDGDSEAKRERRRQRRKSRPHGRAR